MYMIIIFIIEIKMSSQCQIKIILIKLHFMYSFGKYFFIISQLVINLIKNLDVIINDQMIISFVFSPPSYSTT